MKNIAFVILSIQISQSATSSNAIERAIIAPGNLSPSASKIYEFLSNQKYSQLITSYCPEMGAFFTQKRIAKYCRNNFDDVLESNKKSVPLNCNSKKYLLTKGSISGEGEAREISAMAFLSTGNLKNRLIFAEDCVYQGEVVILIHPRVISLDNMMDEFRNQASDPRKRIAFMMSLTAIYADFENHNFLHGATLLNAIVVDFNDISKVRIRNFSHCSFQNKKYPPVITSSYSLAAYDKIKGPTGETLREKTRIARLMMVIQDYIRPSRFSSLYETYLSPNSPRQRLHHQSQDAQNTRFNEWCKEKEIHIKNIDVYLELLLCRFAQDQANIDSFSAFEDALGSGQQIIS